MFHDIVIIISIVGCPSLFWLLVPRINHPHHSFPAAIVLSVRRIFSIFLKGRSRVSSGIDTMISEVYAPILWRALSAQNWVIRHNAALFLRDAFPIGSLHFDTTDAALSGDSVNAESATSSTETIVAGKNSKATGKGAKKNSKSGKAAKGGKSVEEAKPSVSELLLSGSSNPTASKDLVPISTQIGALLGLLDDPVPQIREIGISAICDCLALHWSLLPQSTRILLLNKTIEHASDASSPQNRAATIHGFSKILSHEMHSHSMLHKGGYLQSIGRLLHDKHEKVRLAVLHFLALIEQFRGSFPLGMVTCIGYGIRAPEPSEAGKRSRSGKAKSVTGVGSKGGKGAKSVDGKVGDVLEGEDEDDSEIQEEEGDASLSFSTQNMPQSTEELVANARVNLLVRYLLDEKTPAIASLLTQFLLTSFFPPYAMVLQAQQGTAESDTTPHDSGDCSSTRKPGAKHPTRPSARNLRKLASQAPISSATNAYSHTLHSKACAMRIYEGLRTQHAATLLFLYNLRHIPPTHLPTKLLFSVITWLYKGVSNTLKMSKQKDTEKKKLSKDKLVRMMCVLRGVVYLLEAAKAQGVCSFASTNTKNISKPSLSSASNEDSSDDDSDKESHEGDSNEAELALLMDGTKQPFYTKSKSKKSKSGLSMTTDATSDADLPSVEPYLRELSHDELTDLILSLQKHDQTLLSSLSNSPPSNKSPDSLDTANPLAEILKLLLEIATIVPSSNAPLASTLPARYLVLQDNTYTPPWIAPRKDALTQVIWQNLCSLSGSEMDWWNCESLRLYNLDFASLATSTFRFQTPVLPHSALLPATAYTDATDASLGSSVPGISSPLFSVYVDYLISEGLALHLLYWAQRSLQNLIETMQTLASAVNKDCLPYYTATLETAFHNLPQTASNLDAYNDFFRDVLWESTPKEFGEDTASSDNASDPFSKAIAESKQYPKTRSILRLAEEQFIQSERALLQSEIEQQPDISDEEKQMAWETTRSIFDDSLQLIKDLKSKDTADETSTRTPLLGCLLSPLISMKLISYVIGAAVAKDPSSADSEKSKNTSSAHTSNGPLQQKHEKWTPKCLVQCEQTVILPITSTLVAGMVLMEGLFQHTADALATLPQLPSAKFIRGGKYNNDTEDAFDFCPFTMLDEVLPVPSILMTIGTMATYGWTQITSQLIHASAQLKADAKREAEDPSSPYDGARLSSLDAGTLPPPHTIASSHLHDVTQWMVTGLLPSYLLLFRTAVQAQHRHITGLKAANHPRDPYLNDNNTVSALFHSFSHVMFALLHLAQACTRTNLATPASMTLAQNLAILAIPYQPSLLPVPAPSSASQEIVETSRPTDTPKSPSSPFQSPYSAKTRQRLKYESPTNHTGAAPAPPTPFLSFFGALGLSLYTGKCEHLLSNDNQGDEGNATPQQTTLSKASTAAQDLLHPSLAPSVQAVLFSCFQFLLTVTHSLYPTKESELESLIQGISTHLSISNAAAAASNAGRSASLPEEEMLTDVAQLLLDMRFSYAETLKALFQEVPSPLFAPNLPPTKTPSQTLVWLSNQLLTPVLEHLMQYSDSTPSITLQSLLLLRTFLRVSFPFWIQDLQRNAEMGHQMDPSTTVLGTFEYVLVPLLFSLKIQKDTSSVIPTPLQRQHLQAFQSELQAQLQALQRDLLPSDRFDSISARNAIGTGTTRNFLQRLDEVAPEASAMGSNTPSELPEPLRTASAEQSNAKNAEGLATYGVVLELFARLIKGARRLCSETDDTDSSQDVPPASDRRLELRMQSILTAVQPSWEAIREIWDTVSQNTDSSTQMKQAAKDIAFLRSCYTEFVDI